MKIYSLNFSFFSALYWCNVEYEIKAESKIQLLRTFIEVTEYMSNAYNKTLKEQKRELWEKCKNDIEEETLQFPIIKEKRW